MDQPQSMDCDSKEKPPVHSELIQASTIITVAVSAFDVASRTIGNNYGHLTTQQQKVYLFSSFY